MKKIFEIIFAVCAIVTTASCASHDKNNIPYGKSIPDTAEFFIGQPYIVAPLGEGKDGKIDKSPLFRFDGFDCVTYVETVLALHLSSGQNEFEKNMNSVRYADGKISYENRNHFIELNWIKNNSKYVTDITNTLPGAKSKTIRIDKNSWANAREISAKFEPAENVTLPYIPRNKIDSSTLKKLPNTAIINILKWDPNVNKKIGTELFVYHMGFLIDNRDFYHASTSGAVVRVDFIKYIESMGNNFVGINVLEIRPQPL